MIGQSNLLTTFKRLVQDDKLPNFFILVGNRGSGKHLILHELSKMLNATEVDCGTKIDDVRTLIDKAYTIKSKMLYEIFDADIMSIQAKNSLLKVAEEPPKDAYIVITLTSLENTLDTLKSRASIYQMDRYTPSEIGEYSEKYDKKDKCLYENLCDTPGECDILYALNPQEFYDYVSKVVDNIATTSGSNVFKIADKIALKEGEQDKYDLILFWKCFNKVLFDRRFNMSGIAITNQYLRYVQIKSLNKQMLFDNWILDIREKWRTHNE